MEARKERRARQDERFGDDLTFGDFSRQLQSRRDSLINEAQRVAGQAYQTISTTFSTFPVEVRSRYPQLAASIGAVTFPRLHGANFGAALMADAIFGTFGAEMNDISSGCKIQHNMNVMQQCLAITSQQIGLVTGVQGAIMAAVQQYQSNMQNLDQQLLA